MSGFEIKIIQLITALVALTCGVMFIHASRCERDWIIRVSQYVWAGVMLIAAVTYFVITMDIGKGTDMALFVRLVTPAGWGALAVIAARRACRRVGN